MGKKRFNRQNNVRLVNESNFVKINEEVNGQTYFEIDEITTCDVAEAVAIMIRMPNLEKNFWKKQIKYDFSDVEPRKALYWLTGGNDEWIELKNYNISWVECDLDFQEEFGLMVMSILNMSKTLSDVRDGFIKYLNLPVLYEFALSKKFIR